MRLWLAWPATFSVLLAATALASDESQPNAPQPAAAAAPLPDGLYAVIQTRHGAITAELYFAATPLTVANFVGLAEGTIPFQNRPVGKPFYDGLLFHRVVPGFVVQGGDPLGDGEGGPGYEFTDEFSPQLKHDTAGVLAMANGGPNTNGSQFYFTLAAANRLNYKHTVFGRAIRGLDVLPAIREGDAIERVQIIRVGARAEAFRPDAESFTRLREQTPVIAPRDPALPPLYTNDAGVETPDWFAAWMNEKLQHYAAVTGVTVWVRTTPGAPAASGSHAAGFNPAHELHAQLAGSDPRAATLLYVVNDQRWWLWFGDGLLARFGFAAPLASDGDHRRLHAIKEAILAEARAQLAAGVPRRSIDAAITGVIEALDRPQTLTAAQAAPAQSPATPPANQVTRRARPRPAAVSGRASRGGRISRAGHRRARRCARRRSRVATAAGSRAAVRRGSCRSRRGRS